MTGKRATNQHNRIVTAFVKIPEPLADGKVRCPGCSRVFTPTKTGGVRMHVDNYGDPCPYRGGGTFHLQDGAPPVTIPTRKVQSAPPRKPTEVSRLDAGSECRQCGKWLPGERSLCGACYVQNGGR